MGSAEIDALRASMRSAQVFGKGQYILTGVHILQVQKLFYKRTNIDGVGKESIITEFVVVSTTNPEMTVGETRSAVYNFEKKGWLSRFKAMTLALVGVDPDSKVPTEAEDVVSDVYAALKFDEERVRLGLPENFMGGRYVRAEGINDTIKNGAQAGKPIVAVKWMPSAGPTAVA